MPTTPDTRARRRAAILHIIGQRSIARQAELVRLLQAQGIDATQSSVSRDLRELGISKLDDGYARIAAPTNPAADAPVALVREVRTAGGCLTVIHTATGAAARVALFLDRRDWSEIVGTVSGDDTIFVATRNSRDQRQLLARLRAALGT